MFSIAIFGKEEVDGSKVTPGERIIALALFGGVEIDLASSPPPPEIDVFLLALLGSAHVKVRRDQGVNMTGVSILGGRKVEPADSTEESELGLPLNVAAFSIMGGIDVKRVP
ncbi:MAG: hypothetical protein WBF66_10980 [Dehalococcoidia bacterium]